MSVRWKILCSILAPVLLVLMVLTATLSSLVLSQSAREIDEHLAREASELNLLAERATDPRTGQALTAPDQLLELYITRTIPDPNETMFVVFEGSVFARTSDVPPVRLDRDAQFVSQVLSSSTVSFGDWPTAVGNARYVVVPVVSNESSGALVAIIFSDLDAEPIRELLLRFLVIASSSLLVVLGVGYLAAGRIFRPIETLTQFAGTLSEDRLGERLDVAERRDELGQLAHEFNIMLDRLEAAFQAQRQFVDVAGHELRTPLTIVRGHVDLIKADVGDLDSAIAVIDDELSRMSRLVTDLQMLTRASAPEFIRLKIVDLQTFADELRNKIRVISPRVIEVDTVEGSVEIDPQRLSQAALQLVENALKYTGDNDRISVSMALQQKFFEISVEDSGPGVSLELAETIWEPFVRGKGQQNIEGSGIGLSLVRAIALAHGGTVELGRSELGGARFVVRVPR